MLLSIMVLLGLSSLLLVSPTVLDLDEKIVGGRNATIEEYPYQVSIEYFKKHGCGGALIRPNFVLTAAHCTHGLEHYISYMTVRAGSTVCETGGQLAKVSKIFQHPKYNRANSQDYDMSLLQLDRFFLLNSGVQIIPLQTSGLEVRSGTLGIVTGWGALQHSANINSILQVVVLPKLDSEQCAGFFPKEVISARMNCFGYVEGGKDTCQGDSGGPLVVDGRLAGIISWGYGCALPNYPGVYTKVSDPEIVDHINSIVK